MKKIKLFFITLLALSSNASLCAQTWKSDPVHSQLTFTIKHLLISNVSGVFGDFNIILTANRADFSDAGILLAAKATSVNTGVDKRDGHLRSADFFDVDTYPDLTYTSTSVEKLSSTTYKVHGNLTMHGITKPVELEVEHGGTITNSKSKKEVAGFKITAQVNRSDFGIGSGFASSVISDEVRIIANVEMQQQ